MARLARLVIPGLPHHVTQRGNRRQQTFFCDEDYAAYLELMAQWCAERGVAIWGYCLMPGGEFRGHEFRGHKIPNSPIPGTQY